MFNTHRFTEFYYYTFKNFTDMYNPIAIIVGQSAPFNYDTIQKLGFRGVDFLSGDVLTQVEEIFNLALLKFDNWYAIRTKDEILFSFEGIRDLNSRVLYPLAKKLKLWYYSTYEKYSKLLAEYNTLKDKLINNIESTINITSDRNDYDDDTPQVKIVDGSTVFDKSHASYYRYGDNNQEQTSEANTMYNVEKLEMLNNKLFNVKDEWATTLKDFILSDAEEGDKLDY